MQQHLASGLAAAEAAALARREPADPRPNRLRRPTRRARELAAALAAFDEPRRARGRRLAARRGDRSTRVLRDVVVPYLHELGERWERGEASIAQEHFASSFLRGRLLGLARGWGRGLGRAAVLACAPGEQHDLGLIAFGLALRARGWRIVYLGADTPLESVADAARSSNPGFVVISTVDGSIAARSRALRRARRQVPALHRRRGRRTGSTRSGRHRPDGRPRRRGGAADADGAAAPLVEGAGSGLARKRPLVTLRSRSWADVRSLRVA